MTKQLRIVLTLSVFLPTVLGVGRASGQVALPTASRTLQLSAFGGVSGVYTGLAGGKNLSITAGADLGFLPFHGVRPSVEVRGTFPIDDGSVDSQKSVLAGVKLDFLVNHRFRPYGDILFGRGEVTYRNGYFFNYDVYLLTTTNVLSPGLGFEYDISRNLAVKLDGQIQHWGVAPTPSGTIYSKIGTAGIAYRFNFAPRRNR